MMVMTLDEGAIDILIELFDANIGFPMEEDPHWETTLLSYNTFCLPAVKGTSFSNVDDTDSSSSYNSRSQL